MDDAIAYKNKILCKKVYQHNKMEYNNEQKEKGLYRYDVGVDANNFYPVALEDILNYYKDSIPWYERDGISYD